MQHSCFYSILLGLSVFLPCKVVLADVARWPLKSRVREAVESAAVISGSTPGCTLESTLEKISEDHRAYERFEINASVVRSIVDQLKKAPPDEMRSLTPTADRILRMARQAHWSHEQQGYLYYLRAHLLAIEPERNANSADASFERANSILQSDIVAEDHFRFALNLYSSGRNLEWLERALYIYETLRSPSVDVQFLRAKVLYHLASQRKDAGIGAFAIAQAEALPEKTPGREEFLADVRFFLIEISQPLSSSKHSDFEDRVLISELAFVMKETMGTAAVTSRSDGRAQNATFYSYEMPDTGRLVQFAFKDSFLAALSLVPKDGDDTHNLLVDDNWAAIRNANPDILQVQEVLEKGTVVRIPLSLRLRALTQKKMVESDDAERQARAERELIVKYRTRILSMVDRLKQSKAHPDRLKAEVLRLQVGHTDLQLSEIQWLHTQASAEESWALQNLVGRPIRPVSLVDILTAQFQDIEYLKWLVDFMKEGGLLSEILLTPSRSAILRADLRGQLQTTIAANDSSVVARLQPLSVAIRSKLLQTLADDKASEGFSLERLRDLRVRVQVPRVTTLLEWYTDVELYSVLTRLHSDELHLFANGFLPRLRRTLSAVRRSGQIDRSTWDNWRATLIGFRFEEFVLPSNAKEIDQILFDLASKTALQQRSSNRIFSLNAIISQPYNQLWRDRMVGWLGFDSVVEFLLFSPVKRFAALKHGAPELFKRVEEKVESLDRYAQMMWRRQLILLRMFEMDSNEVLKSAKTLDRRRLLEMLLNHVRENENAMFSSEDKLLDLEGILASGDTDSLERLVDWIGPERLLYFFRGLDPKGAAMFAQMFAHAIPNSGTLDLRRFSRFFRSAAERFENERTGPIAVPELWRKEIANDDRQQREAVAAEKKTTAGGLEILLDFLPDLPSIPSPIQLFKTKYRTVDYSVVEERRDEPQVVRDEIEDSFINDGMLRAEEDSDKDINQPYSLKMADVLLESPPIEDQRCVSVSHSNPINARSIQEIRTLLATSGKDKIFFTSLNWIENARDLLEKSEKDLAPEARTQTLAYAYQLLNQSIVSLEHRLKRARSTGLGVQGFSYTFTQLYYVGYLLAEMQKMEPDPKWAELNQSWVSVGEQWTTVLLQGLRFFNPAHIDEDQKARIEYIADLNTLRQEVHAHIDAQIPTASMPEILRHPPAHWLYRRIVPLTPHNFDDPAMLPGLLELKRKKVDPEQLMTLLTPGVRRLIYQLRVESKSAEAFKKLNEIQLQFFGDNIETPIKADVRNALVRFFQAPGPSLLPNPLSGRFGGTEPFVLSIESFIKHVATTDSERSDTFEFLIRQLFLTHDILASAGFGQGAKRVFEPLFRNATMIPLIVKSAQRERLLQHLPESVSITDPQLSILVELTTNAEDVSFRSVPSNPLILAQKLPSYVGIYEKFRTQDFGGANLWEPAEEGVDPNVLSAMSFIEQYQLADALLPPASFRRPNPNISTIETADIVWIQTVVNQFSDLWPKLTPDQKNALIPFYSFLLGAAEEYGRFDSQVIEYKFSDKNLSSFASFRFNSVPTDLFLTQLFLDEHPGLWVRHTVQNELYLDSRWAKETGGISAATAVTGDATVMSSEEALRFQLGYQLNVAANQSQNRLAAEKFAVAGQALMVARKIGFYYVPGDGYRGFTEQARRFGVFDGTNNIRSSVTRAQNLRVYRSFGSHSGLILDPSAGLNGLVENLEVLSALSIQEAYVQAQGNDLVMRGVLDYDALRIERNILDTAVIRDPFTHNSKQINDDVHVWLQVARENGSPKQMALFVQLIDADVTYTQSTFDEETGSLFAQWFFSKARDNFSAELRAVYDKMKGLLKSKTSCLARGFFKTGFKEYQDLTLDVRRELEDNDPALGAEVWESPSGPFLLWQEAMKTESPSEALAWITSEAKSGQSTSGSLKRIDLVLERLDAKRVDFSSQDLAPAIQAIAALAHDRVVPLAALQTLKDPIGGKVLLNVINRRLRERTYSVFSNDDWKIASQLNPRAVSRVRSDLLPVDSSLFRFENWGEIWGKMARNRLHGKTDPIASTSEVLQIFEAYRRGHLSGPAEEMALQFARYEFAALVRNPGTKTFDEAAAVRYGAQGAAILKNLENILAVH